MTSPVPTDRTSARPLLAGVVPPLCTPLTEAGEVDDTSLRRLVDHMLGAGVDGVFVLGSSGEASALTDRQRDQVVDVTVAQVAGRVPVFAGAIDTSTARTADQICRIRDRGVAGLVATAPFYATTHRAEILEHFRRLAEVAGDLPLYAYDIPSRVAGTKLDPNDLVTLGREGAVAGVKDSSGSDASIRAIVLARTDAGLPRFSVMTGSELTVDGALAVGADGVVPGLGNVDPHGYVRLYRLTREGRVDEARAEQERLFRLFDIVSVADQTRMGSTSAALGAFKAGAHLLGVIDTPRTAPPSVQLNDAEIAGVRACLVRAGLLDR